MTSEERLDPARELTRRLLARHGETAIAAIGLHGDQDGGALNLAVVTADAGVEVAELALRYGSGDGGDGGVVVEIAAISEDAYLHEAGQIGPLWPLAADQYLHQVALHDPGEFFHKLRHVHEAAVSSASDETFSRTSRM